MITNNLFSCFTTIAAKNLLKTKILNFSHLYLNPPPIIDNKKQIIEENEKHFHTIVLNSPFPTKNPPTFNNLFKKSSPIKKKFGKSGIARKKSFKSGLMKSIFSNSDRIICADGGANHLLKYSKKIIPDVVCGDFDSVKPETLKHYAQYSKYASHFTNSDSTLSATEFKKNLINGTKNAFDAEQHLITDKLFSTPDKKHVEFQSLAFDQDTNDLEKCLNLVTTRYSFGSKIGNILIYGGGGRLDQELANLSSLLKFQLQIPEKNFFLVSEFSSSVFLLPNFKYKFSVLFNNPNPKIMKNSENFYSFAKNSCGIMPFNNYGKANVKTLGLKWNLNFNEEMKKNLEIGKFVSSSNKYALTTETENEKNFVKSDVEIETFEPVLLIQNHLT